VLQEQDTLGEVLFGTKGTAKMPSGEPLYPEIMG